ncbi:PH domain-containing protein [Streptomyces sp. NPDC088725]|uniref:PH domain-containing protein n=1 Tax=Streptomyces sp. NPDC088725 TaxID=3365873 RepID=UPI003810C7B7
MTSSDQSTEPTYADRVFRSSPGIAGGALLLALALWLGVDALISGAGSAPWLALAGLLLVVPLIVAFTLRPAVFASADRVRIRNPFRTITLPWGSVESVRAGYSTEVLTGSGKRFQMWAVPVSLRQRKRASRRQARDSMDDPSGRTSVHADVTDRARLATADRTVGDLRELLEQSAIRPTAKGEPQVRWAYEIVGPGLAGLVLLIVLLAIG